jgi:hypothetical protein
VLVYVTAIGAGLLFGIGSVVQQRVAFDAPPGMSLRPTLLWWLVRQPVWLAGVGTALVGNGLSATALSAGSVALVQPLLVSRLLFALPLSAAWARQHLVLRDWVGLLATALGLATFVAVGRPEEGAARSGSLVAWLLTAAVVAGITVTLVVVARRLQPAIEASVLGAGAGMLFGMQSGLMHTAINHLTDDGLGGLLRSPATYAVPVVAITGTLLAQSAYEMAPLHSSYPTLASVEPLAGIGIAVGVLGSTLTADPLLLGTGGVGLLIMTVGIYLLATSPLVAGQAEVLRRRKQEETAAKLEESVEHRLDHIERDLEGRSRLHPTRRVLPDSSTRRSRRTRSSDTTRAAKSWWRGCSARTRSASTPSATSATSAAPCSACSAWSRTSPASATTGTRRTWASTPSASTPRASPRSWTSRNTTRRSSTSRTFTAASGSSSPSSASTTPRGCSAG